MKNLTSSREGHSIKNNIREFDPFVAEVLAEYCEQLINKKQGKLNISESILLKSIEMQCSDEDLVVERELAGVIRSAKRILEETSEGEWSEDHRQLFLLLKKIVFVGIDDDSETSDSDIINQVVDGLMRLDYSQDIPVFEVIDEERNIFNYIGYILGSLAEKFKESTVSVKAVNTYLSKDPTKGFLVLGDNGSIRFASRRLEKILQVQNGELIDLSIFDFVPAWNGKTMSELTSNHLGERIFDHFGNDDKQLEAYIQLDAVILSDDQLSDDSDEVKEYVLSVDFDTTSIDEDEEVYNQLTSIDSVIDAVRSLKKGDVSPSEHNYRLQTSLESLYKIKYAQLDKLNKVEEPSEELIDPKTVVNSILSELRFQTNFEKVEFSINSELSESFLADFETVYSILKHVISNAIKYTAQQENPQVTIQFSKVTNAVLVEISDNGIGIEKDQIDKVFEKGYRGSKEGEGYGMGLYFIKRCLMRCNGSIAVESEPGKGSKFSIYL